MTHFSFIGYLGAEVAKCSLAFLEFEASRSYIVETFLIKTKPMYCIYTNILESLSTQNGKV